MWDPLLEAQHFAAAQPQRWPPRTGPMGGLFFYLKLHKVQTAHIDEYGIVSLPARCRSRCACRAPQPAPSLSSPALHRAHPAPRSAAAICIATLATRDQPQLLEGCMQNVTSSKSARAQSAAGYNASGCCLCSSCSNAFCSACTCAHACKDPSSCSTAISILLIQTCDPIPVPHLF